MTKVYKISFLLCLIALTLVIGDFVLAQGKGYFIEKDNEFFILDSLYINGYLIVEESFSENLNALFGDVLVEEKFVLDKDSKFYFCKDERYPQTNLPKNTDCENKVLIWYPESDLGLKAITTETYDLYELRVEKIIATATETPTIKLSSGQEIITNDPVRVAKTRIDGCFVNDGTENCPEPANLKTEKLYLTSLTSLDENEIEFEPSHLTFEEIDLGTEDDALANQNLCWRSIDGKCGEANGGKDFYAQKEYESLDGEIDWNWDGLKGTGATTICCYLCVDGFNNENCPAIP